MGDSDLSFKLVTIQGITAFFMLFGLTGMALKRMHLLGDVQPLAVAAAAGIAMTYVQAKFMTMLYKLQSSGKLAQKDVDAAKAMQVAGRLAEQQVVNLPGFDDLPDLPMPGEPVESQPAVTYSRRMDEFEVETSPEGTTVTMKKWSFRDELASLREERRRRD